MNVGMVPNMNMGIMEDVFGVTKAKRGIEMEHELLFINPELKEDLNVTVRRGDKWYQKASVGDLVVIKETETMTTISMGRIRGIAYIPYLLIPQEWLELEHDHLCRNRHGLLQAMIRAYPNFSSNGKEMITVIIFELEED